MEGSDKGRERGKCSKRRELLCLPPGSTGAPGLIISTHPHPTPSSSTPSRLQENLLAVSLTLGRRGLEPVLPLVRTMTGRQVGNGDAR